MKDYMKSLFAFFTTLLVLLPGVQTEEASAQNRGFTRCPKFVVSDRTGEYIPLQTVVGERVRCSSSVRALRNLGYRNGLGEHPALQPKPLPPVVGNPELDVERVLTGKGSLNLKRAFRVSATARTVTVILRNCSGQYDDYVSLASMTVLNSNGQIVDSVYMTRDASGAIDGSLSFFNQGIYGIQLDVSTLAQGSCDFEIAIR